MSFKRANAFLHSCSRKCDILRHSPPIRIVERERKQHAAPITDLHTKTLETRISQLESILKPGLNSITLQVGTSKIVITESKIELVCQGTIQIKSQNKMEIKSSDVKVTSYLNTEMKVGGTEKASGTMLIAASGDLVMKGATIQQS